MNVLIEPLMDVLFEKVKYNMKGNKIKSKTSKPPEGAQGTLSQIELGFIS